MALMVVPQAMNDAFGIIELRYVVDDTGSESQPTTLFLAGGKVMWQQGDRSTDWHGDYRLQGPMLFLKFYCFQENSRLKCLVVFRVNEDGIVYKGRDSEEARFSKRDGLPITITFVRHIPRNHRQSLACRS